MGRSGFSWVGFVGLVAGLASPMIEFTENRRRPLRRARGREPAGPPSLFFEIFRRPVHVGQSRELLLRWEDPKRSAITPGHAIRDVPTSIETAPGVEVMVPRFFQRLRRLNSQRVNRQTRQRLRQRFSPSGEQLEPRAMMAITAVFDPVAHILRVNGDAGNNEITLSRIGLNLEMNGGAVAITGGSATALNTSLVVVTSSSDSATARSSRRSIRQPATSASGSVFESTPATAASRGRRFRPPDHRRGRN